MQKDVKGLNGKAAISASPEAMFAIVAILVFAFSATLATLVYWSSNALTSRRNLDFDGALRFGVASAVAYCVLYFVIDGRSPTKFPGSCRLKCVLSAWGLTFLLLAMAAFLFKESAVYSRASITITFVVGLLAMPLFHRQMSKVIVGLFERGRLSMFRIAVVCLGDADEYQLVVKSLAKQGFLAVVGVEISTAAVNRGKYLSRCSEATQAIQAVLKQSRLDAIWILAPMHEQRRCDELRAALSLLPLPIVFVAEQSTQKILNLPRTQAGLHTGFEIQRAPLSRSERALKRALDISTSLLALAALSPVMLGAAIAIRLEGPGLILFIQDRKGFGGRPFKILKFRSMSVQENGPDVKQAESHDPRVTAVGRVLRRTSIDELPQLINVLKGEMSMVGPRPHALSHDSYYDRLITSYAFRHHVKPGITGWAQVNGYRGNTKDITRMEARVEHDLWYINHWSIWLDLRILARTALEVLAHDEAY